MAQDGLGLDDKTMTSLWRCHIRLIVILSTLVVEVSALGISRNSVLLWESLFSQLLSPPKNDPVAEKRSNLKQRLCQECCANFGNSNKQIRENIEDLIDELAILNPTKDTAASPMLMQEWNLEWTTEKEINFFLQNGISERITQKLSQGVLQNYIPFVKGGGFGVTGKICRASDISNRRTEFQFTNAKLDLGKWGVYNFPPVGKGWFDTIYLDDELRIDSNSRDDILICTVAKK